MDNLTHSLVGLAASKAGLERLSPHATLACVLAANAPDSDILTLVEGRWAFLQHHRGLSHSIIGTLVLALVIPLAFYAADHFIARLRRQKATVNLKGLTLASLIVAATHPFMDWTNNYGIRLLLPWKAKWFYGDLVFIVDPFLWLLFGGAAFLLTSKTKKQIGVWLGLSAVVTYVVMFGPAARGGLTNPLLLRIFWLSALALVLILFKLQAAKRWGSAIGLTAFAIAILYWGSLAGIHAIVLRQAQVEAGIISSQNLEPSLAVAAMPTLANPFHWQCVVETRSSVYRFDLSLFGTTPSNLVHYEKPDFDNPPIAEASRDKRAQVFLGFARFPVASVVDTSCPEQTLVQFADLRYTQPGRSSGTFSLEVPVECSNQNEEKLLK
jgi:inner membrane protein